LAAPVFDLSPEQVGALPPEVQARYQASIRSFQAGNNIQGMGEMLRAAQAAPESADLQLVLARLGRNMSEEHPDNAQQLLGVARVASQRVIDNPNATAEQTTEAQEILGSLGGRMSQLQQEAASAASREAVRAQIDAAAESAAAQQRAEAARQQATQQPGQQPERNANGTPRYTGAVRNYQAIQQARDLQQGSNP
jgi:hypothetical protein